MRARFDQNQLTLWLLLLLPMVFYLHIVNANSFNIPYWDDYQKILLSLNQITETPDPKVAISYFLEPSTSHIPLVTRAVAWLQIKLTGHINFRWGVILGNLGLVASVYLLVLYLNIRQRFPLDTLLPVPFFLFSITHWFAMHFMVTAWQFYWGSTLFPLLVFIAILEQRYILASIAFAAAIFTCSGSLALYPLVMLFCLTTKRWRHGTGFGLMAGAFVLGFYLLQRQDPSLPASKIHHFNLWQFGGYIIDFFGSLIPDTHWNSQYIQPQHYVAGVVIISAGLYGVWKIRGMPLSKLILSYTLTLPCMAYYLRADKYPFIPSRYSLFSLMAAMSICMMFIGHWITKNDKWTTAKVKSTTIISILVWAYSIQQCKIPLSHTRIVKSVAISHYLETKDPAALAEIAPDTRFAQQQLDKARTLGIFLLAPPKTKNPD